MDGFRDGCVLGNGEGKREGDLDGGDVDGTVLGIAEGLTDAEGADDGFSLGDTEYDGICETLGD